MNEIISLFSHELIENFTWCYRNKLIDITDPDCNKVLLMHLPSSSIGRVVSSTGAMVTITVVGSIASSSSGFSTRKINGSGTGIQIMALRHDHEISI